MKLPCGCKVDDKGRLFPLNMCPTHHIEWSAFHKSAADAHAAAWQRDGSEVYFGGNAPQAE